VTRQRVELPSTWTEAQRDGLRSLLEQTEIDADWEGELVFTCSAADAEQALGLVSYFDGDDRAVDAAARPPPNADSDGDPRELAVAGRGLRLAGWFVDVVVFALISAVLLALVSSAWPRFVVLQVLYAVDAIALVVWFGGNVGNLVVGTQVVQADDATRPTVGQATVRWAVIAVPVYVAGIAGAWWFGGVWGIVVYGPILFTRLHQGLHDRAARVLVITSRYLPERWAFANAFFRRVGR
jgi:hypothetical protein